LGESGSSIYTCFGFATVERIFVSPEYRTPFIAHTSEILTLNVLTKNFHLLSTGSLLGLFDPENTGYIFIRNVG
jgi:hypothetical protein